MAPPHNRRPGFSRRAQYGFFLAYVVALAGAIVSAVLLALSSLDPPAFASLRASLAEQLRTKLPSGLSYAERLFTNVPNSAL